MAFRRLKKKPKAPTEKPKAPTKEPKAPFCNVRSPSVFHLEPTI